MGMHKVMWVLVSGYLIYVTESIVTAAEPDVG